MTEVECRDKKEHLSDFSKKCSKVLCKPQFVFLLTFITLHNEPWFSMDMLSNWCQIEGDTAILTYFAFCVWRINEIFSINYWSIGFIVGITTMNTCKSLFLDITIRGKDYLLSFNLHLFISLYPDCIVWRMKWRKWRMAYLAYALFYSSGSFHCANWRSRFSNSDLRSSLVTSA